MITSAAISPYLKSSTKRYVDFFLSLIILMFTWPLFILISLAILILSGSPIFFTQKRLGKKSRPFHLIKFRTMRPKAHTQQWRYRHLNEADGPVFKIKSDPRFVGIGKFLANTGLDELPQLFNIIKGDMSFVGPRPLPLKEAKKLSRIQSQRHLIRPGITSPWVINGAHSLKFSRWMQLDLQYLQSATFTTDLHILINTGKLIINTCFKQLFPSQKST